MGFRSLKTLCMMCARRRIVWGAPRSCLAGLRSAQSCLRVPLTQACVTGRHPLTELVTDTYIPNDTKMTAQAGRVQVPPIR